MSVEEMAKKFSEKWGVPMDEAKRHVKAFLNKNPKKKKENAEEEDRSTLVPGLGDLFPKPLGEISRKIQDINQATISTAMTRRYLKAHPDDVEELRKNVGELYEIMGAYQKRVESKIDDLTGMLDEKQRQETREALFKELDDKIGPLRDDLETIKKGLGEPPEGQPKKPEEFFDAATEVTERAKGLLEKAGYRVVSGHVSREEVEEMIKEAGKRSLEEIPTERLKEKLEEKGFKVEPGKLSREEVEKMIEERTKKALESAEPEELKKRLEASGYRIAGGPITWTEAEELVKKAKQEGQEEVLDDKRIDAVKELISTSIAQIFELFKPAVNTYLEYAITGKGGEPTPSGSPATQKQEQGTG